MEKGEKMKKMVKVKEMKKKKKMMMVMMMTNGLVDIVKLRWSEGS